MLNCKVIRSNFNRLRREKAAKENRDLPLHVIAAESGLSVGTVHKVSTGEIAGVRVSTIDALCRYFAVSGVQDLLEFSP